MTAFTIFVLLLTFGYLVYFAVMITLELHKKEEVQKSDEEVFDVSDMTEQEEPTCIEEHMLCFSSWLLIIFISSTFCNGLKSK